MALWPFHDHERAVRRGLETIHPRLWRYCVTLTGNRTKADDLVQAACLRALEKAALFEPGTTFAPWIFRLTQRVWLNEMRAQAVRTGGGLSRIEEAELTDLQPDPEHNAMNRDIWLSVMELPEAQRATVMLVYVEGHSYKEAAIVLDIPIGTVMSRLAAARGRLAATFQDQTEAG